VETGDVIWPADAVGSKYGAAAREPEGIRYYYAPLAYVFIGGQRHEDLRCLFSSLPCRAPSIVGNVAEIDADVREAAAPAPAPATRRRAAAKPKPR